jgi:tetratricopeptide (TPR) repeat protein
VWPSRTFGLIACSALAWFWWWLLKPSPPAPPPPPPPSAQNKSTAKKSDAKKVEDKKVDAKKADGPAGRADIAKAPAAAAPPVQQTGPVPSLNSVLVDVDMDTARKYIRAMLIAASDGHEARIEDGRRSLQQVRAPQRGDRVNARALNVAGLDAVRRGQFGAAVNIFLRAAHADPGDQEIMNNLAHALFKNGQLAEGRSAAIAALVIAPERTTAWAELAQILACSSGPAGRRGKYFVKGTVKTPRGWSAFAPSPPRDQDFAHGPHHSDRRRQRPVSRDAEEHAAHARL